MIFTNLYEPALIVPVTSGAANKLFIVSGYASAAFARRHLVHLNETGKDFEINLVIGMPGKKDDHLAFLLLHKEFKGRFRGYYLHGQPSVHCKVYSWFRDATPCFGFSGSANYSRYGFDHKVQVNQLSNESPQELKKLYEDLKCRSTYIPDHKMVLPKGHRLPQVVSVPPGDICWEIPNQRVTISFLDKKGNLPEKSGLNWGQRLSREPDQAYLSLKGDSREEGFLPKRACNFSLITDDGRSFDCVVAQDGRKAIQSTNNNSEIGLYIRNRIGIPSGAKVTVTDLEKYGRTDYTIEKINDETFLLDFLVGSP